MKSIFILFALFYCAGSFLHSQNHKWQIMLSDEQKISLQSLQLVGDSVVVDYKTKVSIASIVQVKKVSRSRFWTGAGIGLVTGVAVGVVIGLATYEEPERSQGGFTVDINPGPGVAAFGGGILGGISGFIIGGIVGWSLGGKSYELGDMRYEKKLMTIQELVARDQKLRSDENTAEWKVVEVNLSDIVQETDTGFEIRVNNTSVALKKYDVKVIRKTTHSIVLALPIWLYEKTFPK